MIAIDMCYKFKYSELNLASIVDDDFVPDHSATSLSEIHLTCLESFSLFILFKIAELKKN